MNPVARFVCLLFSLALIPAIEGVAQTIKMRPLSVDDGLPQGQVRGIVQDKQGFVWLAADGLSRYDGRHFFVYRHDVDDSATIKDNDIRDLQIDSAGRLWLSFSSKELDLFDPGKGRVRHLSSEPAFRWLNTWTPDKVHYSVRQVGSRFFAVMNQALMAFDPVSGRHWRIAIPEGEDITAFGSEAGNGILVATTRGLYKVEGNHLRIVTVFPSFSESVYALWTKWLHNKRLIGTIFRQRDGGLVIPTLGGVYVKDGAGSVSYLGNPAAADLTYACVQMVDGTVYYRTEAGIHRLNGRGGADLVYGNGGLRRMNELLLADHSGVLWATADVYGLQVFDPHPANFRSVLGEKNFSAEIMRPWMPPLPVSDFYGAYEMRSAKDSRGDVWVLHQVRIRPKDKLLGEYTQLVRLTGGKAVLYPLDYGQSKPVQLTFAPGGRCWMVLRDTAGGKRRRLVRVDPATGVISPFALLDQGWRENSYLAAAGRYVCYITEEAIHLYDTTRGGSIIRTGKSLGISSPMLMACPDPANPRLLWIATKGSGIVRFDLVSGTTSAYTTEQGLPNNTVYFLAPDRRGLFWCSSNKGLFRFNPQSGAINAFTVKDGLQGNEFNRYHFLETPQGRFIFGGVQGYTVFHPDSVRLDPFQTPVVVTQISINGKPLQQLDKHWKDSLPSALASLDLPHDQNFLGFSFAGLQFDAPEKLRYRYRLLPIDREWVYDAQEANARYAALSPGSYTFQVNAANTSGQWSSQVRTIAIQIHPPWWLSWWMYCVYIAIICGGIWLFLRNRLARLKLHQQVVLKQKEAEQAHALEETKSRFFANVTHELRTPLTLILSPVQQQLQSGSKDVPPQLLHGVYQQGETLLRLINQLLDVSKLEGSKMPVHLHRGELAGFIATLLDSFKQQAKARRIRFGVVMEDDNTEYLFDADKLQKIVYNLLSNAFKFTADGGRVGIAVQQKAAADGTGRLYIRVTDNGVGIAPRYLPFIFDRFYQANDSSTRKYEGTGIGLSLVREFADLLGGSVTVESEPGKGSVFTFQMPLRVAAGNEEELSAEAAGVLPDIVESALPDQETAAHKPLILVAEDNAELRYFIQNALSPQYRVVTAVNGEEGWNLARTGLPDLIISDVMMPVMDGYDFCAQVKHDRLTCHIGMILLTAKTAGESRVSGLRLGADAYLGKPFLVEELLLTIRNLLNRQQCLREQFQEQLAQETSVSPAVSGPEDALIKQIYDLVDEHLDSHQLDVEFLSTQLSVSRRTLLRKVSVVTGLSVNELIRDYRLKRSADFLKTGDSVASVAYKAGFSSASYFAKCFKDKYNVTPLQYTQQARLAGN